MSISTTSLSSPLRTAFAVEDERRLAGAEAARLLRLNRSALAEDWAMRIRSHPNSSYSQVPLDEIRRNCEEGLSSFIALLDDGNPDPLWKGIDRVCQQRAKMQFPSADIVEAITLFLDSADEIIGPKIAKGEDWRRLSAEWRYCMRKAVRTFVNSYWIHLEIAQASF